MSTAVLNVAALCVAIWIAGRCGGRRLVLGVAAFLAVATAWYGASVLTQPWNPYLPLVAFIVALLAAWAVLEGHTIMLVPLVVAASLCAQTHVPYLTLGVALCAVGFVGVGWRLVAGALGAAARAMDRRRVGAARACCCGCRR